MSFSSSSVRAIAVPVLLLLLSLAIALSLLVGAKPLPASVIVDALSGTCQSADCVIVLDARLPRTLAGLLAGGALGLAGALMQTLTRNPLADPGILGVNSGASFAIVLGAALFGLTSPSEQLVMAFCGALAASLVVAFTGSQGGGQLSPVRLTLAGVALAAVLEGLSNGIALLNPDVYDQLRFWQAGSLDIRTLETLKVVAFPVIIAAAVALFLSRALNSLSLGSDTATALGNRVARTQLTRLGDHHRAVRQRDRRGRPDCLYRPDDAAHVALAGGDGSPLVAAGHAAGYSCAVAVCRRAGSPAGAGRAARLGGQRLYRRAGADLPGSS